jgi:hypothetical protein
MDLIKHIDDSIRWGEREVSKLNQDVLNIHGITSNKVRSLLNNICSIEGTYLEVGVFRGATCCSAIYNNDKLHAIGIDNFASPNLMPMGVSQKLASYLKQGLDVTPQENFIDNVKRFGDPDRLDIYKTDYTTFDYSQLPKLDIVFYDGDTKFHDQYVTLKKLIPQFSDKTILIMDDWNWDSGALYRIIDEEKLFVSHQKEIFTKGEDMEDFWNGIGIFLIEK